MSTNGSTEICGTENNSAHESPPNVPADTTHESSGIGGKGNGPRREVWAAPRIYQTERKILPRGDIRNLLEKENLWTPGALLYVNDIELRELGFKLGHVAELKWALKKMVGKEVEEVQPGTTELYEGKVGRVIRKAERVGTTCHTGFLVGLQQFWLTGLLQGGVGGKGGAGGKKDGAPVGQGKWQRLIIGSFTVVNPTIL
ncbi:hypothetical protein B0H11DRAFT_1903921 [Mycena galericulata]|nr:hypothetical protein B0H11DRAFT_1903921 [Mycena galericulata]